MPTTYVNKVEATLVLVWAMFDKGISGWLVVVLLRVVNAESARSLEAGQVTKPIPSYNAPLALGELLSALCPSRMPLPPLGQPVLLSQSTKAFAGRSSSGSGAQVVMSPATACRVRATTCAKVAFRQAALQAVENRPRRTSCPPLRPSSRRLPWPPALT